MALTKSERRLRIRRRIRKVVTGTAQKPRLSVFRSNKEIYASIVDDTKGVTICAASSLDKSLSKKNGTKTEQANLVGSLIAERAISKGVKKCAFDRNGYLYHGRIKSLADSARESGLKF